MSEPQVDFDTMGPSQSDFTSFTCTYVCVCVSEYICVCGACFSLQGGSEAQGSRPYTQPGSQGAAELGLTARHPGSTFLSYFWKKITLPSAAVLGLGSLTGLCWSCELRPRQTRIHDVGAELLAPPFHR